MSGSSGFDRSLDLRLERASGPSYTVSGPLKVRGLNRHSAPKLCTRTPGPDSQVSWCYLPVSECNVCYSRAKVFARAIDTKELSRQA